jgi:hypothetical protein
VSRVTIANLEIGATKDPRRATLARIARALEKTGDVALPAPGRAAAHTASGSPAPGRSRPPPRSGFVHWLQAVRTATAVKSPVYSPHWTCCLRERACVARRQDRGPARGAGPGGRRHDQGPLRLARRSWRPWLRC